MRRCLLIVQILLGLACTGHAADDEFNTGFQNFQQVLTYIKERYENPEFDQESVLVSALVELNAFTEAAKAAAHVDSATEDGAADGMDKTGSAPEAGGTVASGTEAYADLTMSELLMEVTHNLRDATQNAEEIFGATPPTPTDLWNATISGLVNGLHDPYSQYLPPAKLDDLNEMLSGDARPEDIFYGVGIHVDWDMEDRGVMVLSPIPGGPADTHGIQMGDIIIGVDGEPVDTSGTSEEDLTKAIDEIKGPENSEVRLTIYREGIPVPLEKTLKRAPVNGNQQIIRYMLDDDSGIGYIRLMTFNQHCAADVETALEYLYSEGMKKLIFDLRFNPGGYLDQAVMVADLFMAEGKLITYTQGRSDHERQDFIDRRTSAHHFESMPMVIILNEYSASASEVVTGALKDSGRCKVVGAKSFGKGSVQEVFPLHGDAALRLTVAKYYTPGNRCIHEIGIEPDYVVSSFVHQPTDEAVLDAEQADDEEDAEIPTPTPTPAPHYENRVAKLIDRDAQFKKAYEVLVATSLPAKEGDLAVE